MASMQHEGLVLLFRNRPTLAPELLRDVLGVALPAYSEARVESADLTEVVPTEYRADLVVLLVEGRPIFAIVVEVQLSRDVTDEQAARRDPELAVLSAMAHGQHEVGETIAQVVLSAVVGLEAERVRLYVDLALSSLGAVARTALEALMRTGKYEYQSDFARGYVAQGREEGRREGREEGRQEGRQQAELQTLSQALLEVLDARGLEVDPQARQRLQACTDLAQLKSWLRGAVTVSSAQALFEPESKPPSK